MRLLPFALLLAAACTTRGEAHVSDTSTASGDVAREAQLAPAAAPQADTVRQEAGSRRELPATVRALYVNRWATQSAKRMRHFIAIADSTEINGLVLDVKDEFGLNYTSRDTSITRNAGRAGAIPKLKEMLDTLRAHGIVSIARMVVFKDSVAARMNPTRTIRKPDGTPWRDKQGLTWVDPYDPVIREYNIRVAEELARLGFDEIQFDYIRFPEPYPSLPKQVFPDSKGVPKPQALQDFLKVACRRINTAGARCTADIFGLVTTVRGALEIGQEWEKISPAVDAVLPMTYPSHYPRGSFGVKSPNADPETIQRIAISKAHDRDITLGITTPEHVRPWIQAFTLGKPPYTHEHITAQKNGIYAAGYDGWVLWSPGSKYEIFLPALEKTMERRAKDYPAGKSAAVAR